jgi:hypothetical protein
MVSVGPAAWLTNGKCEAYLTDGLKLMAARPLSWLTVKQMASNGQSDWLTKGLKLLATRNTLGLLLSWLTG